MKVQLAVGTYFSSLLIWTQVSSKAVFMYQVNLCFQRSLLGIGEYRYEVSLNTEERVLVLVGLKKKVVLNIPNPYPKQCHQ